MKILHLSIIALLISGCASTSKQPVNSTPILVSPEQKLEKQADLFTKDTVALTQLAQMQLKQYEQYKSAYYLDRAITTYQELITRQADNDDIAMQYYRLNLFKGLAENNYDITHWQHFYNKYPFLKNIDLAPPEYMEILLADRDSLSKNDRIKILKKTLAANPNFVNAYLELTAHYAQRDKNDMALFLLETANKYSSENVDILAPLNDLRIEKVFDGLCRADMGDRLNILFDDAKLLAKGTPEDAYAHMQLSTVLRLMGRNRMSSFSAKKAASLSSEYQEALAEAQFWNANNNALNQYFSDQTVADMSTDDLYLNIFFNVVNLNWQKVTELLTAYLQRSDISFYGVLYGSHAYKMLGDNEKAQHALTVGIAKITLEPWQKQMLSYANQEISSEQLFAASQDRCNQSEAYFIQGLQQLQAGQSDNVKKTMKEILALNVYPFYEYAGAKGMLKALKTSKPES